MGQSLSSSSKTPESGGKTSGESSMAGVPNTFDADSVEIVQRSGKFGKLMKVERENASVVIASMRSNQSYRSKQSSIQDGFDKDNVAPPQHATWPNISAIMISEVVGAGVLTLSAKYAQLGWILPTIFIVLIFFLVVYTSRMMVEVKKVFGGIISLSDAGLYTYGRAVEIITGWTCIAYVTFTLGDYLLLIGKSMGSTFYDVRICQPYWLLIGSAILVPITQLRTLNATTLLCALNMASIIIAVALVIAGLVIKGRESDVETYAIAQDLDFMTFMQALSNIFFTFGGQFMFYELMAEMKDFTEFPKTFYIAGPFQVPIYLIVGCVGYYFKGEEASGYFLDNLGFGWMYRLASALLCFHMLVAFLILANVLARIMHIKISPYHVNDLTLRGKAEWFGMTSGVIIMSFIISNAIPFFEDLSGLIGGIFIPFLNMIFPISFYIKMKFMIGEKVEWWEWMIYIPIIAAGVMICVVSTIQNVTNIISNWGDQGAPFSCHCAGIWNTCACSEMRMEYTGLNCTM